MLQKFARRADLLAAILSLAAVLAAFLVARQVFEGLAHLEDEQAFTWQAQALARGKMWLPSPEFPKSFLWPFVIDHNGKRFGKYPLGWPLLLALGEALDVRIWVNPLLGGLGVWLTYLLGKRAFGSLTGLLAAGLTLSSPFFLMLSGSLLSHPLGLVLSAGFILCWLEAFVELPSQASFTPRRRTRAAILAGLALGALALTRPWTAVGVALPCAFHGIFLLLRGESSTRQRLLLFGGVALCLALLHFAWQWAVSGDPQLNPYTLWWPYDQIGFGPGHGPKPEGHTLAKAYQHLRYDLRGGFQDLFGWGHLSWIFLPLGLLAVFAQPKRPAWLARLLLAGPFASLLLVYMAYWVGNDIFGPRYYYEGLFGLTILSAAGIVWLEDRLRRGMGAWGRRFAGAAQAKKRFHSVAAHGGRFLVALALLGLVGANLVSYLPQRLEGLKGLYGISREKLAPFLEAPAQALTPALVIVHPQRKWIEYGALLALESPFLDTPFIFAYSRGAETDAQLAALYPERRVLHYYADEPGIFYNAPRDAAGAD